MINQTQVSILRSGVNSFISLLFVAVFAGAAALMIWQTATGQNPIANEMAAVLTPSSVATYEQ